MSLRKVVPVAMRLDLAGPKDALMHGWPDGLMGMPRIPYRSRSLETMTPRGSNNGLGIEITYLQTVARSTNCEALALLTVGMNTKNNQTLTRAVQRVPVVEPCHVLGLEVETILRRLVGSGTEKGASRISRSHKPSPATVRKSREFPLQDAG